MEMVKMLPINIILVVVVTVVVNDSDLRKT